MSRPVPAVASTAVSALLAAVGAALGATMCILPWYNVTGPNLKGFILLRERGIFKECITTNLNENNRPISKDPTYTCAGTGGTPCSDYTDSNLREGCYNQTRAGYMSVGAPLFIGVGLFAFIGAILYLVMASRANRKNNTTKVSRGPLIILGVATFITLIGGIFAALGRYYMSLVFAAAGVYAKGLAAASGVPVLDPTYREANSTSLAAAIIGITAALTFPLAFRLWASHLRTLENAAADGIVLAVETSEVKKEEAKEETKA
ncbi:hypothetical protein HDU97_005800 [Phlyctochytrium planicorne]|nr:hypothetical protein HDU97_005800 [Phlyctochytrium planicorne]